VGGRTGAVPVAQFSTRKNIASASGQRRPANAERAITEAFYWERHTKALLRGHKAEAAVNPEDEDARHRVLDTRKEQQLMVVLRISLETLP
jgi:hypothetical protein